MPSSSVDLAKVRCPDCGATYLDFRRTGRLGCPYDYVVFRAGVTPLLDRVQRASHHTGKRPARTTDERRQRQVRCLWTRLREAVKSERYDEAADLRDQIRSKERENGSE